MNFAGKTFLVTGGVRRLGMQISLALAKHGANVVLHHVHSPAQAEEVKRAIEEMGQKAWIISWTCVTLKMQKRWSPGRGSSLPCRVW